MSHNTQFLIRQFAEFSISCAKPTHDELNPIFNFSGDFDLDEARKMKNDIRNFLFDYYKDMLLINISEAEHIKRLRNLSTILTRRYKNMLFEGRYRLGVTQKIVNTFLKLAWAADLIKIPHHCPFDNKVRRKIQRFSNDRCLEYWTEFTSVNDYKQYVSAASKAASQEGLSIAEWDIIHFK